MKKHRKFDHILYSHFPHTNHYPLHVENSYIMIILQKRCRKILRHES